MAIAKLDEWVASPGTSTLTRTASAGSRRMGWAVSATRNTGGVIAATTAMDYGGLPMKLLNQRSHPGGAVRLHLSLWSIREDYIADRDNNIITPTYDNTPANTILAAAIFSGCQQRARVSLERAGALTNASTPNPFTTLDFTLNPESYGFGAVAAVPATTVSWHADMTERIDVQDGQLTLSIADVVDAAGGLKQVEGTFASQNRALGLSVEIANRYRRRLEDYLGPADRCVCGHLRAHHGLLINESRVGTFLDTHCRHCECEQYVLESG